jgi:SPP1 family predicted phage head-tail adaptor
VTTPCLNELNRRLTVEVPARTSDDGGSAIISWQPAGDVWGDIRAVAARETVGADGRTQRVSHEIRLRYRADLTGGMRLRLGARIFDIRALRDPDERRRWLICQTEERRP